MSGLALPTGRSLGRLAPATSCLLLCDVQERFRPIIHNMESVISASNFLLRVGAALDVPCVATEQYSKVFGPTIPDVLSSPAADGGKPSALSPPTFEKKLFSMCTPEVVSHLRGLTPRGPPSDYVLFGIEAHVCVQQTALDLLSEGHSVHVVVDAVSSQSPLDRAVALERMRAAGAFLTTAQSVAFGLCGTAEHPSFKAVSRMVVEHGKVANAFHEEARGAKL